LTSPGIQPALTSPAQFRADIEADLARWKSVSRKSGIVLE